jgi:lipoprotein NlpD
MPPHRSPLHVVVRTASLVALTLVVGACATRSIAPVEDRRAPAPRTQVVPSQPPAADAPIAKPAEPDWRPQSYTVRRGDTLHAIALEHGLDYRDLAAWNAIPNPNRIEVGQVLRLTPPGEAATAAASVDPVTGVTTAPLKTTPPVVEARGPSPSPNIAAPAVVRNTETLKVAPKAIKEPYSEQRAREMAKVASEPVETARNEAPRVAAVPPAPSFSPPAPASPPATTPSTPPVVAVAPPSPPRSSIGSDNGDDDLDWIWPAKGKIVTGFSDTANLKGIDIAGTAGQPVVASAPGKVVYAGSGLRGYGKLVIIKHNNTFLSAYAHNRDISVKEGQQVTRGQKIAEMGSTDADQVKLHFEIRRLGKPMDPMKFLPPG